MFMHGGLLVLSLNQSLFQPYARQAQKAAPAAPGRNFLRSPRLINSFQTWAHHFPVRPARTCPPHTALQEFISHRWLHCLRRTTNMTCLLGSLPAFNWLSENEPRENAMHGMEQVQPRSCGTMVDWQQEMCYWDMVTPMWAPNQEATSSKAAPLSCKVGIFRPSTCSIREGHRCNTSPVSRTSIGWTPCLQIWVNMRLCARAWPVVSCVLAQHHVLVAVAMKRANGLHFGLTHMHVPST